MRKTIAATLTVIFATSPVLAIEPIGGSITLKNPTAVRLQKSPVGSQVAHEFYFGGERYKEVMWFSPTEASGS
ncbi:hypothetical protein J2857_005346 [Neorhizobium galegae]|uniref:hypothetical protein n=1 Tax=Neorhizobium galegae TaxID=399 RepID=UPI001EC99108|nr:hypothetical protein [Neorhizobium galegae]MBP2562555.1 hypothetical protein [Neorhizobium galegae]